MGLLATATEWNTHSPSPKPQCLLLSRVDRPVGRPWTGGVRDEGSKLVDGGGGTAYRTMAIFKSHIYETDLHAASYICRRAKFYEWRSSHIQHAHRLGLNVRGFDRTS